MTVGSRSCFTCACKSLDSPCHSSVKGLTLGYSRISLPSATVADDFRLPSLIAAPALPAFIPSLRDPTDPLTKLLTSVGAAVNSNRDHCASYPHTIKSHSRCHLALALLSMSLALVMALAHATSPMSSSTMAVSSAATSPLLVLHRADCKLPPPP